MCANHELQKYNVRPQLISEVLVYHILDQISKWPTPVSITYSHYGEPLMHPKLADFMRKAKDTIGSRLTQQAIFTNGALLTVDKFRELVDAGMNYCSVSLDGFTKETYESIRLGLNYDTVVGNLMSCAKVKLDENLPVHLRTHMVYGELNHGEVNEFLTFWRQYPGIDSASCLPDDGRGTGEPFEDNSTETACSSPFSCIFVLTSGDCVQCCQDIHASYILGNAFETSLHNIWNGERYKFVRKAHKDGKKRVLLEACRACAIHY